MWDQEMEVLPTVHEKERREKKIRKEGKES